MTKVFAFLGNERPALKLSRHNAGFIAAEEMRKVNGFPEFLKKEAASGYENYEYSKGEINGETVILVKPIAIDPTDKPLKENGEANPSYGFGDINHSGFGLRGFLKDYEVETGEKIGTENITVFVDALSKENFPKTRYIANYSCEDETHNGVKSIGNEIGGGFVAVEIPIGKQAEGENLASYVSGNFENDLGETRILGQRYDLTEFDRKVLHSLIMAINASELVAGNFNNFVKLVAEASETVENNFKTKLDSVSKDIKNNENSIIKLKKEIAELAEKAGNEEEILKKQGFIQNSVNRIEAYNDVLSNGKDNLISDPKNISSVLEKTAKNKGKKSKSKNDLQIAIENGNEKLFKDSLNQDLQNKSLEQKAQILTNCLITTFQDGSTARCTNFGFTKIVLDQIKSNGLNDKIISSQLENEKEELAILHKAIAKNIFPEQLEMLLDSGFGVLVDKEINGKTPLKQSLEIENIKVALPIFWQIYPHSRNLENIDRCIEYAKDNEKFYTISKEQKFSTLEIAKMLPHRLLKEQKNSLEFQKAHQGNKPKIFMPYYDYAWGRAPKQVLCDFGCEITVPDYDLADDSLFSSPEALTNLKSKISEQVRASNGLNVLGNFGNIDTKFFTEGETVDLSDFYQRRTFVEMVAFQEALKQELPIWTICGGTQMAITALGGKITKLDVPQDLRGQNDLMKVKEGSLLHLATHSENPERGNDLLNGTQTFSAHYQGADVARSKDGVELVKTDKFSVFEAKDSADEFAFEKLPENVSVIAVSKDNPHIPKAYELNIAGKNCALMIQSHLEADPSTNPASRNAIGDFAERCRSNFEQKSSPNKAPTPPEILVTAQKIETYLNNKVTSIMPPSPPPSPQPTKNKPASKLKEENLITSIFS